MPLHHLTEEELRSIAKGRIEAMERWLRRLVHEVFTQKYGPDYFHARDDAGNVIKSEMRKKAESLRAREPNRYPRLIDATLLDHVVDIVTKPRHWPWFQPALGQAFPEGDVVAKALLRRVVAVRNPLYHGNTISLRQAEQACCYSNDVIDALKSYYVSRGEEKMYNAPTFFRAWDSLGTEIGKEQLEDGRTTIVLRDGPGSRLRPGDQLSIEVEVDPTFEPGTYDVTWKWASNSEQSTATRKIIDIEESDVGEDYLVMALLRSDKPWHRFRTYDASLNIVYRVLPPL